MWQLGRRLYQHRVVLVVALFTIIYLVGRTVGTNGPFLIELTSPSGIPYACMYESREDFVSITYEEVHRNGQESQP